VTTPGVEASPNAPSERKGYVGALDGVRAIAVALVVLFHLGLSAFTAGFVGVDVFFVVSGFLITTLMLEERARTGRISLPAFWARRARRLLPALALLLVAVAIVGAFTDTFSELATLRADLLTTTFYVANWHFIHTSSYFNFSGFDSPLQHTWSLAIEEQFYLAWPLVVAGVLVVARRSPRGLGIVATVAAIGSALLLGLLWAPASVERAYMGTDARIFEPLIGAAGAVAMARPWGRRLVERNGMVVCALGGALLAVGLLTVGPTGSFYYRGGAVLISLATLLVVSALWVGRGGPIGRILGWGPIAWIGAISYGIYLWHWPYTLWLDARETAGLEQVLRRALVVALTVGTAALSYYLVERPIRSGLRGRRRDRRDRSRTVRRTLVAVPLALVALACVSVASTRVPPPSPGQKVVLFTGDSVPKWLESTLERSAKPRGWRIFSAAIGGCSVTGEVLLEPDASPLPGTADSQCPTVVPQTQDAMIAADHPDIVVWWDRFSITGFQTADGERVAAGSDRFWELKRTVLDDAVHRLTSGGAKVVFVATEPPGIALDDRAQCPGCTRPWIAFEIAHYEDVTQRWNAMMRDYARKHPDLAGFVSVTDTICARDVSPCDDRIDGVPARPEGTHYGDVGKPIVVEALLDALAPYLDEKS
jgi:peptidoglycan/LPS O-acetylase OafA/YrhL